MVEGFSLKIPEDSLNGGWSSSRINKLMQYQFQSMNARKTKMDNMKKNKSNNDFDWETYD